MRKVIFGGANSLDNYIARKDDAVDWLMWSNEAAAVMTDYWKTIDTIVMGRKTYEVALRMGAGGGAYAGYEDLRLLTDHAASPGKKKIKNLEFISEDAADVCAQAKGAGRQRHLRHGRRPVGEVAL